MIICPPHLYQIVSPIPLPHPSQTYTLLKESPDSRFQTRRGYLFCEKKPVELTLTSVQVPNIPLLTGFHKIRGTFGGFISTGDIAMKLITKSGRGGRVFSSQSGDQSTCSGTPFVNVTFTELLWGYYDAMPCVNLARPYDCPAPPEEVFHRYQHLDHLSSLSPYVDHLSSSSGGNEHGLWQ